MPDENVARSADFILLHGNGTADPDLTLLVQRGRLVLRLTVREWVARSESLSGLHFLPVDAAIGLRAVELTGLHRDPADRMIVATAELLGAVLLTRDERLRAYGGIPTAWD